MRYSWAVGRQGQFTLALKHADRAIALRPGYAQAYMVRAIVMDLMGRRAEAIHDIQKALQFAPKSREARRLLDAIVGRR